MDRRNICQRLFDRSVSLKPDRFSFNEKFARYRLKARADVHDPSAVLAGSVLHRRSRVTEVIAAEDVVFGITQSGVCAAFDRESFRRICFLNIVAGECIRSLFFNRLNRSLITVSVHQADQFLSLKCRSTSIDHIKRGSPSAGVPLFANESLTYPGFVEFDDVNKKVLTYSATNKVYKIWKLDNYALLYKIKDQNIEEIKISPGIMLLIYKRLASHVQLKIIDIENGEILIDFKHLLHRNKKVDFIEQFNEKLLLKQENEPLQIVDVKTKDVVEVPQSTFLTPNAFIFLYELQLFLTFRNREVVVWNFRGELITRFEDHQLWYSDCNTNNIYINANQDTIISYCRTAQDDEYGSINVSSILCGRLISKITAQDPVKMAEREKEREEQQQHMIAMQRQRQTQRQKERELLTNAQAHTHAHTHALSLSDRSRPMSYNQQLLDGLHTGASYWERPRYVTTQAQSKDKDKDSKDTGADKATEVDADRDREGKVEKADKDALALAKPLPAAFSLTHAHARAQIQTQTQTLMAASAHSAFAPVPVCSRRRDVGPVVAALPSSVDADVDAEADAGADTDATMTVAASPASVPLSLSDPFAPSLAQSSHTQEQTHAQTQPLSQTLTQSPPRVAKRKADALSDEADAEVAALGLSASVSASVSDSDSLSLSLSSPPPLSRDRSLSLAMHTRTQSRSGRGSRTSHAGPPALFGLQSPPVISKTKREKKDKKDSGQKRQNERREQRERPTKRARKLSVVLSVRRNNGTRHTRGEAMAKAAAAAEQTQSHSQGASASVSVSMPSSPPFLSMLSPPNIRTARSDLSRLTLTLTDSHSHTSSSTREHSQSQTPERKRLSFAAAEAETQTQAGTEAETQTEIQTDSAFPDGDAVMAADAKEAGSLTDTSTDAETETEAEASTETETETDNESSLPRTRARSLSDDDAEMTSSAAQRPAQAQPPIARSFSSRFWRSPPIRVPHSPTPITGGLASPGLDPASPPFASMPHQQCDFESLALPPSDPCADGLSLCPEPISRSLRPGSVRFSLSREAAFALPPASPAARSQSEANANTRTGPFTLPFSPPPASPGTRERTFKSEKEALRDVTALFYNEERNEIYSGNKYGMLHVWGN